MKALNHFYLTLLLSVLSIICIGVYFLFRKQTYFDFLLWNLFLAWIPYSISILAHSINNRVSSKLSQIFLIILGLAWILFLPNSPYVITDLIHLTILKDAYVQKGSLSFAYWYDFFVIVLFSWIGILLGCSSMYNFQFILMKHFKRIVSWFMTLLFSLLSGYGILLGREYRLNSWDVLSYHRLLTIIQGSLNLESLLFSLLVGLVIMTFYTSYYFLVNRQ
ncbi:DUF1361 domain-containing protein [Paenibacillus sedimenti]|uniref:DUF1361 domain-containing protein n=1 Tax=Paenibacillus sedimenti TaxID=2770274 RepID=A0A926QMA3_9BACL|nr:DUF1361 domain-containing protein [Paenibacillus sedimenti]